MTGKIVTKMQASLMSLVAAVPGGLLAYGMVMSFLQYSERSPLSFKVISGISLVLGLLLALLPLAILAFAGPKAVKEPAKKADGESVAVSAVKSDSVPEEFVETDPVDDLEVAGEDDFVMGDSADGEVTEFVDDAVEEHVDDHAADADDLETFEAFPVDEVEEADLDLEHMETFDNLQLDELDDEEDFPRKKKK